MIPQYLPNVYPRTVGVNAELSFFQSNGVPGSVEPGVYDYYVANSNARKQADMPGEVNAGALRQRDLPRRTERAGTPLSPLSTFMTSGKHTGADRTRGSSCSSLPHPRRRAAAPGRRTTPARSATASRRSARRPRRRGILFYAFERRRVQDAAQAARGGLRVRLQGVPLPVARMPRRTTPPPRPSSRSGSTRRATRTRRLYPSAAGVHGGDEHLQQPLLPLGRAATPGAGSVGTAPSGWRTQTRRTGARRTWDATPATARRRLVGHAGVRRAGPPERDGRAHRQQPRASTRTPARSATTTRSRTRVRRRAGRWRRR